LIKLTDVELYTILELVGTRNLSSVDPLTKKSFDSLDLILPKLIQKDMLLIIQNKKSELSNKYFGSETISTKNWLHNRSDKRFYHFNFDFLSFIKNSIIKDISSFTDALVSLIEEEEFKFDESYMPFLQDLSINKKNKFLVKRKSLIKTLIHNNPDLYPALLKNIHNQNHIFSYMDLQEALIESKQRYVKAKNLNKSEIELLEKSLLNLMDKVYRPKNLKGGQEYSKNNLSVIVDYFNVGSNMLIYKHIEKNILDVIGTDETLTFNLIEFLEVKAKKNKNMQEVLKAYKNYSERNDKVDDFKYEELIVISYGFSNEKAINILSKYNQKVNNENIQSLNVELAKFVMDYLIHKNKLDIYFFAKSNSYCTLMFKTKEDLNVFNQFKTKFESVIEDYFDMNKKIYLSTDVDHLELFDDFMKKKNLYDIVDQSIPVSVENVSKKLKI